MKHSKLGASSLARVFKCPYSIKLLDKYGAKTTTSRVANEGTKLHKDAENAILSGEVKLIKPIKKYVQKCRKLIRESSAWGVEVKFHHPEYPDIFSTCDFYSYDAHSERLYVIDLKTGKGIKVDYNDNKQMQMYAYLFLLNNPELPISAMYLGIYQEHFYDKVEFDRLTFKDLYDKFIKKFNILLTDLKKGVNLKWEAGEHCRFCPVRYKCKKASQYYNKEAIELLKGDNNEET